MRPILTTIITTASFCFVSHALAQSCTPAQQTALDECALSAAQQCFLESEGENCKQNYAFTSNVVGVFKEQCCCDSGEKASSSSFNACKTKYVAAFKNAKDLLGQLGSKTYSTISRIKYTSCTNMPCDF